MYAKRAVKGISTVIVLSVLSSIVAYVMRIVLARYLQPAEYGLFYAVFTLVVFLLFFRDLGLHVALARFIPKFEVEKKYHEIKSAIYSTLGIQFLATMVLVVVLGLLTPYLATSYFKNPAAEIILYLLLLYVLTSVLFRVLKAVLQGFQLMLPFASCEFLKNVVVLIGSLVLLERGFGTLSPVIAYVIAPLLVFVMLVPVLFKRYKFKDYATKNFKLISRKLLDFGVPVTLTGVGGKVIGYIDVLLLTYFVSITEVGVYNVVLPSALLILFVARSVVSVIVPLVSEMWAKRDTEQIAGLLFAMKKFSFVLLTPVILTLVLFAREFITLFFGVEYVSGALALQIILIGTLFYVIGSINNGVITAIGRPKIVTKIVGLAAFLNIVFNVILIPKYGIVGAAFSTAVSYVLIYGLATGKMSAILKEKSNMLFWVKLVASTGFYVVMFYSVSSALGGLTGKIIALLVGLVAYFVGVLVLRIITFKEVHLYMKLFLDK
jgi:O-antigen/teichoic acid export membrane protein